VRIAVLSDVHSNMPALEAVISATGSIDALWLLGDMVGYGPEPEAVVERLIELGASGVRGNHDTAATADPSLAEWFNPEAPAAIEWTRGRIAASRSADWLGGPPTTRREGDWTLVHGSVREPLWEYVVTEEAAQASFAALESRFCLHGHTHVPIAIVEVDGALETMRPADGATIELGERRMLLNPGSVGQPRDGDPTAAWLVLDDDAATVTWHRVEYDIPLVQRRMTAAGLPARLVERLAHGY
jgi:predicted phosphodiesterase